MKMKKRKKVKEKALTPPLGGWVVRKHIVERSHDIVHSLHVPNPGVQLGVDEEQPLYHIPVVLLIHGGLGVGVLRQLRGCFLVYPPSQELAQILVRGGVVVVAIHRLLKEGHVRQGPPAERRKDEVRESQDHTKNIIEREELRE